MRELKIVGLDVDGKHIICEGDDPADKYKICVDDRLRAAVRGDGARVNQTHIDIEVTSMLSPKEIQSRIRSGASVEQLATSAGVDIARVERFAHPVLLERARAAELATAAHPVLTDGPSVLTLLETITSSLMARGLDPSGTTWDAWRNEDGRWTVQLGWKAGRSDNLAHFRFCPGAHGGTVTAVDDPASELIDPNFDRPLRPVAPLAQLDFDEPEPAPVEASVPTAMPMPTPAAEPTRSRRGKPAVPAWEDVLLGVRSSGQR
ncbi:septation protein SepH [Mycobacterium sp.]|uniref:septation protein SepH n=1 Tax=Mycobacterium sp. TaxID=1785 RepID=UPI003BAEB02A